MWSFEFPISFTINTYSICGSFNVLTAAGNRVLPEFYDKLINQTKVCSGHNFTWIAIGF